MKELVKGKKGKSLSLFEDVGADKGMRFVEEGKIGTSCLKFLRSGRRDGILRGMTSALNRSSVVAWLEETMASVYNGFPETSRAISGAAIRAAKAVPYNSFIAGKRASLITEALYDKQSLNLRLFHERLPKVELKALHRSF